VYLETHCNIGSKRVFPPANTTGDTTVYLFTDAQAVYFLHSTIASVKCLRLSDASVICSVIIFSFQVSLLFLNIGSQAAAAAYVVYPILDTRRCRKGAKYVPCTESTIQGEWF